MQLLLALGVAAAFDAAEPIGSSTILLVGEGDATGATVTLDGASLTVASVESRTNPPRTYLQLADPLAAGALIVTAGEVFERTLVSRSATLGTTPTHTISSAIYGQAFAATDGYVQDHGVSVVRWGGNAVTTYNPFVQATNAGSDWYFENRDGGSADDWIQQVLSAGADALLTVPALDWVSKDTSSYSFSVATYGAQDSTDPWKPDAGNGVHDGSDITGNDPTDAYTTWNTDDARTFLESLTTSPRFAAVDNELDIASSTHRDCHPQPMSYDEMRDRWLEFAGAIKDADASHRGARSDVVLLVVLLELGGGLGRQGRARGRGLPSVVPRRGRCRRCELGAAHARPPRRALLPGGRVQRRHVAGDTRATAAIDTLALGSDVHGRELDRDGRVGVDAAATERGDAAAAAP